MASPDIHLRQSFGDDDPPSPSSVSRPIDIPSASSSYHHNNNAWDSVDFSQGALAYTPSYVGSFGSGQDSVWGDREATAVYTGNGGAGDLFDDSKYEPEGYQHASPYLMMDNQYTSNNDSLFASSQQDNIQISFNDDQAPHGYSPRGEPFNAASPGSSIGIPDSGGNGHRSRASSLSSNHGVQSSPYMQPGQPLYDHFGKLTFEQSNLDSSPSWNGQQLPSLNHLSGSPSLQHTSPPAGVETSPTYKPMSPPSLMIPGEGLVAPPNNNASLQAPGEPQPAINLVPATPVSGGGAAGVTRLPFQQMLANLNRQHNPGAFARGNAATAEQTLPSVSSFQTSIESNMGGDGSAAHSGNDMTWSSIISASGQSQGTAPSSLPQSRVYHHGYNVPVLPALNPSQQRSHLAMQVSDLPNLPHTVSDPTVPSSQLPSFSSQANNMSLSETSLLSSQMFLNRSRSKSDTSSRPPIWFASAEGGSPAVSDDLNTHVASSSSSSFGGFGGFSPNMPPKPAFDFGGHDLDMNLAMGDTSGIRRANSDGSRHKRGVKSEDLSSMRGPRLVPTSSTDFIRSVTAADGSLAPVDPRSGGPGPLRRRGSGGAGHERNSSLSGLRSTPYQRPSPHTSPGPSPHHSPSLNNKPLPEGAPYMRVERPLVTTPATKTASANRRRAEASFVCPVPNCGSTFTRHFNLRGHLRSHNEERPFKCKWPGCEKGFARQHDCKRHEALHLNIRPYTCEGCQKTFARMDALNRHLRSEGGVDCQKVHQPTDDPQQNGFPKVENDTSPWTSSGALVM